MGYLVHILNDGNFELIDSGLLALYPDLNSDELILLSDEQYQMFCRNDNGKTKFIDGNFVFTVVQNADESQLLAQRKEALIAKVVTKTDQFKAQYLTGYSQAEIDSFYRQEREARGELPLMLLTELFEGRDDLTDMAQLKAKVIEKADLFAIIMGKIFAIKQNFESHIEQAQTLEELDKIEQEIEQWQL